MTNPFLFSDNYKRYHTLDYHLKQKFGCKVFKVSLNAGFTCPNIDGTKGVGGCTYCSSEGSGEFAGDPALGLTAQFHSVKEVMHKKWKQAKYIAYFQAFTNTYAPLALLKKRYEEVLTLPDVVGISIATRADALPDEVCDYLQTLSQRTYLIVELGLQTIHEETAEKINRCHSLEEFIIGYEKLNSRGINVCVHIINGLPGETKTMMLETAKFLGELSIHSIKMHQLHLIQGTSLAEEYLQNPFPMLDLEEYVDIVCDQLELLPAGTIIQRVTGDGFKETLVAPLWSLKKLVVMNEIDKELKRRSSYQGAKCLQSEG